MRAYFREVVERVNACEPDLVAVTGDLVERNAYIDWIPDTLGRLQARCGVYFVRGNHDLKVDQRTLLAVLAECGLVHVGGQLLYVAVRGRQSVLLAGNELPWFGPAPPSSGRASGSGRASSSGRSPDRARSVSIGDRNQSPAPDSPSEYPTLRILLSHSPDQFTWAQAQEYDLMLAGHNHGGQVRLPLLGPLLAPSRQGTRYASGVFRAGDTVMHVSRGTGSLTPLRYNCPPEVAILELLPAPCLDAVAD